MLRICFLTLPLVLACVASGGDDDDDGPGSGSSTYSNRVRLECNGDVLVDRTFTSMSACEEFARNNEFYCSSIKLPIRC